MKGAVKGARFERRLNKRLSRRGLPRPRSPFFSLWLRPFPALSRKHGRTPKALYTLSSKSKKNYGRFFFFFFSKFFQNTRNRTSRGSTFHPPIFNGTSGVPPSTNVNGELEVEFSHVTLPPDCALPGSERLVFPHPFPYARYHCQPSGLLCTTLSVKGNQRQLPELNPDELLPYSEVPYVVAPL